MNGNARRENCWSISVAITLIVIKIVVYVLYLFLKCRILENYDWLLNWTVLINVWFSEIALVRVICSLGSRWLRNVAVKRKLESWFLTQLCTRSGQLFHQSSVAESWLCPKLFWAAGRRYVWFYVNVCCWKCESCHRKAKAFAANWPCWWHSTWGKNFISDVCLWFFILFENNFCSWFFLSFVIILNIY